MSSLSMVFIAMNRFIKILFNGKEFRHNAHYWEPTYDESVKMMGSMFKDSLKIVKKIGDEIDNI